MAKPLKKYANLNRQEVRFIKRKLNIKKLEDIDITILKQLKEELKKLKDKRHQHMITYKLWDIVLCVIIASFANNNTWEEIHNFIVDNYKWFKSFLQMTGGIPTEDTYERVMGLIDANELNKLLLDFFKALTLKLTTETKMLNFDGRVNNGSKRNLTMFNDDVKPLNCLNVYSNEYGYCIETKEIDEKTNEIPTIKSVIEKMDLSNTIATWDALNTQTKNVAAVIDSNGDYIVPIKGNQGTFYQDLVDYFDKDRQLEIAAGNTNSSYLTYQEKSHGSIITYECFQTSDIKWYSKLNDWKGVKTFGLVKKTIVKKVYKKNERKNAKKEKIKKVVESIEYRYYISSRQVDIDEFNEVTRNHWNIENKVHWHLDFTFCQDKNTTMNKKALLNLEIIHKFVLATLERVKLKYNNKSLKSIRQHLSNNFSEFFPEFVCYLLLN